MPGVWVFTSALYQTTCTVIDSSDALAVVDPNWLPEEVQQIRDFVNEKAGRKELYLIFTHSDYDHIVGYGAFPGSKVIASAAFVLNPNKERDLKQALHFDDSHYIFREYPLGYPEVDVVIGHDGQYLESGEIRWTFYLAPGHTDQGMFIICEPQGVFIAGDYLSDIEFPLISGSIEDYRLTMGKVESILEEHSIRHMIPGHGNPVDSRVTILKRRDQALEYLDDLEALVRRGIPFPESRYRQRYAFWNGIYEWHLENIEQVKK